MPAYIIFHRENGQIVHMHIEPDELGTSREALLAKVDPSHPREVLDIIVASTSQIRAGIADHVDLQTRQIQPAEREGRGFAGAWLGGNSAPQQIAKVPRVYKRPGSDR
jgi:hypothetical protein